jgi:hypothetical protein
MASWAGGPAAATSSRSCAPTASSRAARIRFQLAGQQPFEAQRIVDLDPQSPNNWYLAFFSPKGGTAAMLDQHMLTKVTVFDAAGRVICSETSGRNAPPSERDGCA